jgi:hypothetical protein
MMRRSLWAAVVLMGCQECPDDPRDQPDEPFVPVVDDEVQDAYSYDAARFILALGDDGQAVTCPDQSTRGWTVTRVFSDLFPGDATTTRYTDPLSRQCLYESTGAGAQPTPFLEVRTATGEVVEVTLDAAGNALPAGTEGVSDHVVVGVLAVDGQAVSTYQHARFVDRVGMAIRDPVPSPTAGPQPLNVTRLAILDTTATYGPGSTELWTEPDSHGLWIAALARELTCPEGVACPVELTTRNVMTQPSTSFAQGGTGVAWGTISGLARAIQQEVTVWSADRNEQRVGNLVINLSLAWHPRFGGGAKGAWTIGPEGAPVETRGGEMPFAWGDVSPAAMPPDVRTVFHALALARCRGAMTVAAVGNETGGPRGRSGPMLPAAWEGVDAARTANCSTLGLGRSDPGSAHALVWAAGGLNADAGDLSVHREGSRPHLLAFAEQATHDWGTHPVGPRGVGLTGTSVASIVIASTAAVRWGWEPSVNADDVMNNLYASGVGKNSADRWIWHRREALYPDIDGNEARQVRPCDNFADLDQGYICKSLNDPGTEFNQGTLTDQATGTWPGEGETFEACGDRIVFRVAASGDTPATDPCPQLQYYSPNVSPWIYPQPSETSCGDCFLDLSLGRLYVELPRLWTVSALSVTMKAGAQVYEFNLPPSLVSAGSTELTMSFNPSAAPQGVEYAKVTAVRDGKSLTWPLMLIPAL